MYNEQTIYEIHTVFQSFVLEIVGTNVSTTYVTCPADPRKTLGIKVTRFSTANSKNSKMMCYCRRESENFY